MLKWVQPLIGCSYWRARCRRLPICECMAAGMSYCTKWLCSVLPLPLGGASLLTAPPCLPHLPAPAAGGWQGLLSGLPMPAAPRAAAAGAAA